MRFERIGAAFVLNTLAIHALPHGNVPGIARRCAARVVARLRAIARVLMQGVHGGLPLSILRSIAREISMLAKEGRYHGRHALAERRSWKQTSDSK